MIFYGPRCPSSVAENLLTQGGEESLSDLRIRLHVLRGDKNTLSFLCLVPVAKGALHATMLLAIFRHAQNPVQFRDRQCHPPLKFRIKSEATEISLFPADI
jgi:hypothetical protein